jgi:hypothetical protein
VAGLVLLLQILAVQEVLVVAGAAKAGAVQEALELLGKATMAI